MNIKFYGKTATFMIYFNKTLKIVIVNGRKLNKNVSLKKNVMVRFTILLFELIKHLIIIDFAIIFAN